MYFGERGLKKLTKFIFWSIFIIEVYFYFGRLAYTLIFWPVFTQSVVRTPPSLCSSVTFPGVRLSTIHSQGEKFKMRLSVVLTERAGCLFGTSLQCRP